MSRNRLSTDPQPPFEAIGDRLVRATPEVRAVWEEVRRRERQREVRKDWPRRARERWERRRREHRLTEWVGGFVWQRKRFLTALHRYERRLAYEGAERVLFEIYHENLTRMLWSLVERRKGLDGLGMGV